MPPYRPSPAVRWQDRPDRILAVDRAPLVDDVVEPSADQREGADQQQRVPDVVRVVAASRGLALGDEQHHRERDDVADAVPTDADRPELDQDWIGRDRNQRQRMRQWDHAGRIPILGPMTEQYIVWALVAGPGRWGRARLVCRWTPAAQRRRASGRGARGERPPGSARRSPTAVARRLRTSSRKCSTCTGAISSAWTKRER